MKVVIEKKLEAGKYHVSINVSDYSQGEIEKIKKFGAPEISISPKNIYRNGSIVSSLPIHDMNYDFKFDTEVLANNFSETMTNRIKTAVETLKSKKDEFSGKNELTF